MKLVTRLNNAILLLLSLTAGAGYSRDYRIGISQLVEHPSLNEIRRGMVDGLSGQEGFNRKELNIEYLNAHGNMITSAQIAARLIGNRPDVIVGISTPSAQHLITKKSSIPVVFSGVNDPVSARLVSGLARPEGRVSGVMLVSPVRKQLELIHQVKPTARNVAILYNSGEANSVHIAEIFKKETPSLGIRPILVSISQSSQIQAAVRSLASKADALLLPTDNTVISSLGTILQVSRQNHLPVFASDVASADIGAVAALGADHYEIGLQTARIVGKILRGEQAEKIPIIAATKNTLRLNVQFASEKMGLLFPVSVLKKADKILR